MHFVYFYEEGLIVVSPDENPIDYERLDYYNIELFQAAAGW